MSKVLFVYPNAEGYPIIPLGISLLSAILKTNGHNVDLFDFTFLMPEQLDHKARENTGAVIKVNTKEYWGNEQNSDPYNDLRKKICEFEPDLVAFSIVENNYRCAVKCFEIVKSATSAPIIVGGIFPTIAPEFFDIDIICIGEGEYALLELANRIDRGVSYSNIPNLIVNGKNNPPNKFYDWEPMVYQNWEEFDQRHLWKAFVGKMWKNGCFEMSRGCPYDCYYCNNHILRKQFKCLGAYRREKPIEYAISEMAFMKNRYSLELIFFNDENFLMMSKSRFKKFCEAYNDHVGLPFFMQTKAETISEERASALSDIGCASVGIGVETGNEDIRKNLLNKSTSNNTYKKCFANLNKFGIRSTAYVMLGLPFETEKNIIQTAEFIKEIGAPSIALSIFAPYYGTKLRNICVKNGFMEDRLYENISVNFSSVLSQPQLSDERLKELYYSFNEMVYGK